jgi:hypothetical protein
MSNPFTIGEIIHCSAEFRAYVNSVLTYVDPDNIFFKFRRPGLDTVMYTYGVDAELVRSEEGKYYVDLDAVVHGTWYFKFYSTGANQAAKQGEFDVEKDRV